MLRVRTVFSGPAGTPWLSTMYFTAVTEDQAAATAAVTNVGTFWGAIDARIATSVSWTTDPDVVRLSLAGEQELSFPVTPVTGVGSGTGEMLPPASQGLIRWRTGSFLEGRELRGRTFIPGITEASATAGLLDAGAVTLFNTTANALVAAAGPDLAVWSPTKQLTASVSLGSTWNQFAVLRSRRD